MVVTETNESTEGPEPAELDDSEVDRSRMMMDAQMFSDDSHTYDYEEDYDDEFDYDAEFDSAGIQETQFAYHSSP